MLGEMMKEICCFKMDEAVDSNFIYETYKGEMTFGFLIPLKYCPFCGKEIKDVILDRQS
jgi:hypothetical protein